MKCTHFTVFGERCSGTNHAAAWLSRNTGLAYRTDFGWKHGRMPIDDLRKADGLLCVLVVRNLPDWLRSFHLKPHHLSPKMRGLPFHEFIKKRVDTVYDHTMGVSPRDAKFGTWIESEHHHDKPFANVIRMRRHKHHRWLLDMEQLPRTILLRHEDIVGEPMQVLHRVLGCCGLPARDSVALVTGYKGQPVGAAYAPMRYAALAPESVRHILEQVDMEVESRLGYATLADVQAASFAAGDLDAGILRNALAEQPEQLAMLDALLARLDHQEAQIRHADALARGQRKYLLSLYAAIGRSRPAFAFWPWGRKI